MVTPNSTLRFSVHVINDTRHNLWLIQVFIHSNKAKYQYRRLIQNQAGAVVQSGRRLVTKYTKFFAQSMPHLNLSHALMQSKVYIFFHMKLRCVLYSSVEC